MSSAQDLRVHEKSGLCNTLRPSVEQENEDGSLTSKDTQGSLSSVSMLLDLLESASLKNVPRQEDVAPTRFRSSNVFQRSPRHQQGQLNSLESSREDYFRGKGNRCRGEWKPLDVTGKKNNGLNSKGLDSLHKVLQKTPEQCVIQNAGDFCSKSTNTESPYRSRNAGYTSFQPQQYEGLRSFQISSTSLQNQSQEFNVTFQRSGSQAESFNSLTKTTDQETSSQPTSIEHEKNKISSAPCVVRSEGAWRPSQPLDSRSSLCRQMKGLLNKLTVENFPIVADQITALCASVDDWEMLNELIDLVLDKAFSEPDFSELYADLCLIIGYSNSFFFAAPGVNTSGKTSQQSLFSSVIIKKWGNEFNKLPTKFELTSEQKRNMSPEDQETEMIKVKTRMRGLCVCFGEFLLRKIVSMRGFNIASCILLGDEQPQEHQVEGLCQMLTTTGAYLDNDPHGKPLLDNVFGRLQELKANGLLSKRISCLVEDLFDARKVKWHRKIHKERAKGLSQIKQDAENANLVGGSVVRAQYGTVVQLGQRSNLIENTQYAKYMRRKEEEYMQKISKPLK